MVVDPEEQHKTARFYLKNIVVNSIAFFFIFLAHNELSSLQSSLFQTLGTSSASVTHISIICSSLLLPRFLIAKFGQKGTMLICLSGYILWILANAYATWWSLGSASIVLGVCAAPLHTARNSYITKFAMQSAVIQGKDPNHVVAKYFGITFAIYGASGILSGLMSSMILAPPTSDVTIANVSYEDLQKCGANDCPLERNTTANSHFEEVSELTMLTLVGISLVLTAIGMMTLAFGCDPVPEELQDKVQSTSKAWKETLELASATIRNNAKPEQALLVPFLLLYGLDAVFNGADWPSSYVTCALGVSYVGWTNFPKGFVIAPMALIGGYICAITGRIPLMVLGFMILTTITFIQLFWVPNPDHMYVFYLVPLLDAFQAIKGPAKHAMMGVEFRDSVDATFANFVLWWHLAAMIANAYSGLICTRYKLYIVLAFLVAGSIGYTSAEIYFWKRRQRGYIMEELNDTGDVSEQKDGDIKKMNIDESHPLVGDEKYCGSTCMKRLMLRPKDK